MLVRIEYQDDVCILRLKGRFATGVDRDYLTDKTDQIKKRGCDKLIVDFTEVPYIDSTGLAFIVGLYTSVKKLDGGRFVIVGPKARVRDVLNLTHLDSVIPIVPDLAAGFAFLHGEGSPPQPIDG
jgi:anti-sigma B factor antagonist